MRPFGTALLVGMLAATAGVAAQAQNYYADDMACRQYADQAVAPLRGQSAAQTFGGTIAGAGLGAALGAAIGGGRGAGIGAASGALLGTGVGAANAQNTEAYIAQQYNAYYQQCMAQRSGPPPGYPPPGYAPSPGYAPQGYPPQGYPSQGYSPQGSYYPPAGSDYGEEGGPTAQQLNQQELNQTQQPYQTYPTYPPRY